MKNMAQKKESRSVDEEEKWSSMNLPSPPLLNGKKFDIWSSRMRVYLRYVDTHVDVKDEARDALALHLIQQALDESMLHKVVATKTSKEAWCILEEECSEGGSNHNETAVAVIQVEAEKKLKASVSQTEHKKCEISESHDADMHVDDENSESYSAGAHVDGEDEAAIAATKSVEATQEVAGQPSEAALVDEEAATRAVLEEEVGIAPTENESAAQEVTGQPSEVECVDEKLMKSKPKRVEVCEFASIDSNQRAIDIHEEQKAEEKYDEEILSEEELQILKDEINLIDELLNGRIAEKEFSAGNNNVYVENKIEEDNGIATNKDEEDSSMKAAKMSEDMGSHIAASEELENSLRGEKNEKNQYDSSFDSSHKFDDLSSFVSGQPAEGMDEHEENEEIAENILMKWSLEEIRHYYRLMLCQHAIEEEDEKIKAEDSSWDFDIPIKQQLKNMLKLKFVDGHMWQKVIGKFDDIEGRMRPKELEEMRKKKVRKKKKTRRIVEFRVWSKKKKKKLHREQQGQTNFGNVCLAET